MTMSFSVSKGSGRATCKICGKLIQKTEKQVTAHGYRTQGSIHANCTKEQIVTTIQNVVQ